MALQHTQVDVPDEAARLLCALRHGWVPAQFPLGKVVEFKLGELDASAAGPELRFEGDRLRATLTSATRLGIESGLLPNPHVDFCGILASRATFRGSNVLRAATNLAASAASGLAISMAYYAGDWLLLDGKAPSMWVGAVEGMGRVAGGGNLVVERPVTPGLFAGPRCHFRFLGSYTYYLVQATGAEPTWHLVLDTAGGGVPDGEVLGRDFLVLQFVLGRQLRMPVIVGIASDLRTVAATVGSAIRKNLEEASYPPVPFVRTNEKWVDDCWTSVLFEKVATKWRQAPELRMALWLAQDMYLDAMTNHLDWDYMRLHVALESLAFRLQVGDGGDRKSEVRNKAGWKAWVKANEAVIRGHAVEGRADALYQKVMGASHFSSGRVVPEAFELLGVELTPEMDAELRRRNDVVHQGAMVPDGQYDADRDIRRVAIVRTMLAALVSRAVGYAGAINGWDVGTQGWPVEANGWWSVDDVDREQARRTYLARG